MQELEDTITQKSASSFNITGKIFFGFLCIKTSRCFSMKTPPPWFYKYKNKPIAPARGFSPCGLYITRILNLRGHSNHYETIGRGEGEIYSGRRLLCKSE